MGVPNARTLLVVPSKFTENTIRNRFREYDEDSSLEVAQRMCNTAPFVHAGDVRILRYDHLKTTRLTDLVISSMDYLRFHGYMFVPLYGNDSDTDFELFDIDPSNGSLLVDRRFYWIIRSICIILRGYDLNALVKFLPIFPRNKSLVSTDLLHKSPHKQLKINGTKRVTISSLLS